MRADAQHRPGLVTQLAAAMHAESGGGLWTATPAEASRLLSGPFHSTSKIDYCDPTDGD